MGLDDAPLPRLGARHQVTLLPALEVGAARRVRRWCRGRQHARAQGNPARVIDRLRRVPGLPMKRAMTIRKVAKGAGAVVLGLIALDLVATVVTLAVGAQFLRR